MDQKYKASLPLTFFVKTVSGPNINFVNLMKTDHNKCVELYNVPKAHMMIGDYCYISSIIDDDIRIIFFA